MVNSDKIFPKSTSTFHDLAIFAFQGRSLEQNCQWQASFLAALIMRKELSAILDMQHDMQSMRAGHDMLLSLSPTILVPSGTAAVVFSSNMNQKPNLQTLDASHNVIGCLPAGSLHDCVPWLSACQAGRPFAMLRTSC